MKLLGWVFVIFFILVGINYFFTLAGNFFHYGYGFPVFADGGNQLTSIDFSMFDKNDTGRSYITQGYGRTSFSYEYIGDFHNGIDIAAAYGAPIYSPTAGVVLATGNQDNYCPGRGFGRYVALYDPANDFVLWFAHLGRISVQKGESIAKSALIGTVGASGFETGTHLHFSIFRAAGFSMPPLHGCGPDPSGTTVNPLLYLGTLYQ